MELFNRDNQELDSNESKESEFIDDIKKLLDRDDMNCKNDICSIEYDKAMSLLSKETEGSFERALDIFCGLACELEYGPANTIMGDIYENVFRDIPRAVQWYKNAAELGDGQGARCYADMLMSGHGVQPNPSEAIKYYVLAANQGVPEAAFVLGEIHRNGGNREEAITAYRLAYSKGYELAAIRLQQMDENT